MLRSEIDHADVNRSRYSHLVRELSTVITLRVYALLFRRVDSAAACCDRERVPQAGRLVNGALRGRSGINFGFVQVERFAKVLILLDGDVAKGGRLVVGISRTCKVLGML